MRIDSVFRKALIGDGPLTPSPPAEEQEQALEQTALDRWDDDGGFIPPANT